MTTTPTTPDQGDERSKAYDLLYHFLNNNISSCDWQEYSDALDLLYSAQPVAQPVVDQEPASVSHNGSCGSQVSGKPASAEPDRYKRALEAIIANPGGASAKRIATLALGLDGTEPASAEAGKGVVHQFRKKHCSDWYDGFPDTEDGGGPYETRTLYAHPPESVAVSAAPSALPAQAVGEKVTDEKIDAVFHKYAGANEHGASWLRAYVNNFRIIAREVLALAAPMPQPEPTSKGEAWNMEKLTNILRTYGHSGLLDAVNFEIAEASQQREPQEAAERPANFTELWELYSRVGDAHENHGRNHEKTMEARATFHAALMRALSAPQEASKAAMFCCEHPCALCNDTQKEASKVEPVSDEPFAYHVYIPAEQRGELVHDLDDAIDDLTNCECEVFKLYLRPTQQADAKDAARYRWLRENYLPGLPEDYDDIDKAWRNPAELDNAIDSAILAAAGGGEK